MMMMMMMMTMITMSMTRTVIVINLLHHLQYSGHVQQSQTSHLYRSPPLTNPTKVGFGKTSFSFRPALATFWKETSNDVDVMMSSVSATSKQTNFISNKTQPRKNTSGFTQPVSASKRLILISSNTFLGIKLLSTWTSLGQDSRTTYLAWKGTSWLRFKKKVKMRNKKEFIPFHRYTLLFNLLNHIKSRK